jgi:hypothetical protein
MATQAYGLTPAPHRKVFRALCDVLKQDPTLSRVIRTWSVFDGSPIDTQDFTVSHTPGLRMIPSEGPDGWYGPNGLLGPLVVDVEICLRGSDFDDALDVYHAVRRAIYPPADADRVRIHQALVAAGAEAMFVLECSQGSFAPRVMVDGPLLEVTGRLSVRVRQDLNA